MQFSLFGAAAASPVLEDLDGVLLAGGHWARIGGTARLSIVVRDAWRAAALADEFARRGVAESPNDAGAPQGRAAAHGPAAGSQVARGRDAAQSGDAAQSRDAPPSREAPQGGEVARTAFSAALAPQAARWTLGANQAPPRGFVLTPGGLRLWAIASGRRDDAGYLLGTAAADDAVHLSAGAQLARVGLAAVSLRQRPGPGWRITSRKRLRRLAELLGEPPSGAGEDWPE